jgi:DNA-binding XRE family transcriptional regulator
MRAPPDQTLSPVEFHRWRKHMGLTKVKAAEWLGLTPRTITMYEKGIRPDGEPCVIPKATSLACAAIQVGFRQYTSIDQ